MPGEKPNHQTKILQFITQNGNQAEVRRAQLLMLYEEKLPTRIISEKVGLSPSRVRYWLRQYRSKGLSIFPTDLIEACLEEMSELEGAPQLESLNLDELEKVIAPDDPSIPEILVSDLCENYEVDMSHARFVADLTLVFFDATVAIHQLPPNRRTLAEIAGILHNVGLSTDPEEHDTAGMEILLKSNLIGFDDLERSILAFSTALHRKKHKPKRIEQAIDTTNLPFEAVGDAQAITSLVRIADGLDYLGDQSTKLRSIQTDPDQIIVSIEGPSAKENASRALYKSDFWQANFKIPITFIVEGETVGPVEEPSTEVKRTTKLKKMKSPGILPDDPMSEAGRKTLRFHFYRMLENESGTRLGEDIEALHDMRVATRRMRSAIPIFAPYFEKRIVKRFNKDLRRTGRALGRVRDLDVFMEKAQAYLSSGEGLDSTALDPLISNWEDEREAARRVMLKYLEGNKYNQFVEEFTEFLVTEGAGALDQEMDMPSSYYVFQAVPLLVYQRDSVVRGYAHIIEDAPLNTLHALRIDIKRFRYALEFFEEVLGDNVKEVIKHAVSLQDHLGDLNDADVACQILIEFLDQWRERDRRDQVNISGITHYLVSKQNELRGLVDSFPAAWEKFNCPNVRTLLGEAVASL